MLQDRRTRKTKQAIFRAFNELMQDKRYVNITVQNIIDRADIGRTTFYAHFGTKDELLESYIDYIFDVIIDNVEESEIAKTIPIKQIFEHLSGHNQMLKNLLISEGGDLLFQKAHNYWEKRLTYYFVDQEKKDGIPLDLLKEHIIHSAIGLIQWWSKNDMPYTAEEMQTFWDHMMKKFI